MRKNLLIPLIAALGLATGANASVVSSLQQVGADLVWTYSGTLDLPVSTTTITTGADAAIQAAGGGYIANLNDDWQFLAADVTKDGVAFTGNAFGTDTTARAADVVTTTAGALGLFLSGQIVLDGTHTDGAIVAGSLTWNNLSFADLGVGASNFGDYVWSWTTVGGATETVSLEIVAPSAIPLPAGMPLVLAGLGGLALLRRRKDQSKA